MNAATGSNPARAAKLWTDAGSSSTFPAPMADLHLHNQPVFDAAKSRYVDAWARAAMLGTIVDQPRGR